MPVSISITIRSWQTRWCSEVVMWSMLETTYQAEDWEKPRRIVMVRQEVEKRPKAAGKQVKQLELFENGEDFGKYRYSCFVTDLGLPAKIVYDSYRGRADSENRIKERSTISRLRLRVAQLLGY